MTIFTVERERGIDGRRSSCRVALAMAATIILAGVAIDPGAALAQDEGDDPAAETSKPAGDAGKSSAWTKVEQEADKTFKESLRSGGAFDGAARDFVTKRAVPQLANDANRAIIDRVRRRLRELVLGGIADDRAFDDASRAVAESALAIARDTDASAPARVNAMLLVGDLRAKDGKDGTVWPGAAPLLASAAGDAALDRSVRVAALAGLSRHADVARKAGGEKLAEFAKTARPAVVAIVAEPVPAADSVVSEWLAARALSLVTSVMKSAPKEFAATLVQVMNDTKRPLDTRVRAAAALGATVTAKSEIQAPEAVESIIGLAVSVIEVDEATLRDRRYEQLFGGGGPSGAPSPTQTTKRPTFEGMRMGGGGDPAEIEVPQIVSDQAMRRTAWRLAALADAIMDEEEKTGVAMLLSGEDRDNSKAYAALYRDQAAKIDEQRTDDSILAAVAMIRPDEEDEATAADAAPAETESSPPENDPFGGK